MLALIQSAKSPFKKLKSKFSGFTVNFWSFSSVKQTQLWFCGWILVLNWSTTLDSHFLIDSLSLRKFCPLMWRLEPLKSFEPHLQNSEFWNEKLNFGAKRRSSLQFLLSNQLQTAANSQVEPFYPVTRNLGNLTHISNTEGLQAGWRLLSLNIFPPFMIKPFHGAVNFDWTCGKRCNTPISAIDAWKVYYFLSIIMQHPPLPTPVAASSNYPSLFSINVCHVKANNFLSSGKESSAHPNIKTMQGRSSSPLFLPSFTNSRPLCRHLPLGHCHSV